MTRFLPRRIAILLACVALPGLAPAGTPAPTDWVSTWTAPPDSPGRALPAQTIRQVVRVSVGGARVRIRLSNLFGTAPLAVGSARIALHDQGASIRSGSDHAVTFGGASSVTLPAGGSVLSDAIDMDTAALQELVVSLYLPAGAQRATLHGVGMQTAYLTPMTDSSRAATFPAGATDDSRYFVTDVEVAAEVGTSAIVVVGDSIADGVGSTQDRNLRWPDILAGLLREEHDRSAVAVVNAGIAGNRILHDGVDPFVGPGTLARFDRDALSKPGVRWVILAQGINDIVASDMLTDPAQHASAEQIVDGMRALIRRAHDRGVKICGATLTPLGGVEAPFVHSAEGEAKRQAVNAWIRTSGEFDAVLDADRVLADPGKPGRLLPRFDSGDHLHPNDEGYRALAQTAAASLRLSRR